MIKMLERIVFRTGSPVEQKFLSEEILTSRKTKKSDLFPARRQDNFWVNLSETLIFAP